MRDHIPLKVSHYVPVRTEPKTSMSVPSHLEGQPGKCHHERKEQYPGDENLLHWREQYPEPLTSREDQVRDCISRNN